MRQLTSPHTPAEYLGRLVTETNPQCIGKEALFFLPGVSGTPFKLTGNTRSNVELYGIEYEAMADTDSGIVLWIPEYETILVLESWTDVRMIQSPTYPYDTQELMQELSR
jgi:hypothetical protein